MSRHERRAAAKLQRVAITAAPRSEEPADAAEAERAKANAITLVGNMLLDAGHARPAVWPSLVVIYTEGEKRVTSRIQHAQWLASKGALKAAKTCLARSVPAGHVLVWSTQKENPTDAKQGCFFVEDLTAAIRAARLS